MTAVGQKLFKSQFCDITTCTSNIFKVVQQIEHYDCSFSQISTIEKGCQNMLFLSKFSGKHYSYLWFKYDLGQKYHVPEVQPDRGSNSQPPDHDSTLHVTETPPLTTRPSVILS